MSKLETSRNDEISRYCSMLKASNGGVGRDRERELAARIASGDADAVNELVSANLKYVVTIAKKYTWSKLPFSDLVSEGNMGLIKAAGKFDVTRGTKFITCAKPWIMQSIDAYIKSNVKRNDYDDIDGVDDEALGSGEVDVDTGRSRDDMVDELMACLDERERTVISHYFGVCGAKVMTLDEISRRIGVTQERVRQIKDSTIEKLQMIVMRDGRYAEFKDLY